MSILDNLKKPFTEFVKWYREGQYLREVARNIDRQIKKDELIDDIHPILKLIKGSKQ